MGILILMLEPCQFCCSLNFLRRDASSEFNYIKIKNITSERQKKIFLLIVFSTAVQLLSHCDVLAGQTPPLAFAPVRGTLAIVS